MLHRKYRSLLLLNAALLGVLTLVTLAPAVNARQNAARPRGEYTMVSGRIEGSTEDAIYIVDSTNREMLALRWYQGQKTLQGLGFRDLAADAANATQRRGR